MYRVPSSHTAIFPYTLAAKQQQRTAEFKLYIATSSSYYEYKTVLIK